jgi:hypothetical protein
MTSHAKNTGQKPPSSPATKQPSSSATEMLTPSEIEALQRDKKEIDAYFKKAFGHLRSAKSLDRGEN